MELVHIALILVTSVVNGVMTFTVLKVTQAWQRRDIDDLRADHKDLAVTVNKHGERIGRLEGAQ